MNSTGKERKEKEITGADTEFEWQIREMSAQEQFHKDNNRHLSLDSQIILLFLGFSPLISSIFHILKRES